MPTVWIWWLWRRRVDHRNTKGETGCEVTRNTERGLTAKCKESRLHCKTPFPTDTAVNSSISRNPQQHTFLETLKITKVFSYSPAILGSLKTITLIDFWVFKLSCVLTAVVPTFPKDLLLSLFQVTIWFWTKPLLIIQGVLSKSLPHKNFLLLNSFSTKKSSPPKFHYPSNRRNVSNMGSFLKDYEMKQGTAGILTQFRFVAYFIVQSASFWKACLIITTTTTTIIIITIILVLSRA